MPRYLFPAKIKEKMILGVRDLGQLIFLESQALVPVDKGTLKKSGTIRNISSGIQITYRAPYAAVIEFGSQDHRERVKKHYVRPYKYRVIYSSLAAYRGLKTFKTVQFNLGTRMVTGHGSIPANKHTKGRLIKVKTGYWRGPFERDVKGRPGTHFLQRSVDAWLPHADIIMKARLQELRNP